MFVEFYSPTRDRKIYVNVNKVTCVTPESRYNNANSVIYFNYGVGNEHAKATVKGACEDVMKKLKYHNY